MYLTFSKGFDVGEKIAREIRYLFPNIFVNKYLIDSNSVIWNWLKALIDGLL